MTDISVSEMPTARHVLYDLGFFGHFLHLHAGGRSGQQHILIRLLRQGGSMTQRDLQDEADISSGSLSEVLAKLESAGLIARTRSDEDRRQLDISLTDEGARRAQQTIEERQQFEDQCLTCLSADEQDQLVMLLDRMIDHWKELEGKGECA